MKFVLEDSNTNKRYEFEIDMTLDEFDAWADTQEFPVRYENRTLTGNHCSDFVSEMEEYGVLDVNSGDEEEGYVSYEIEEHDYPIILEKFKEFFKEKGLPVVS